MPSARVRHSNSIRLPYWTHSDYSYRKNEWGGSLCLDLSTEPEQGTGSADPIGSTICTQLNQDVARLMRSTDLVDRLFIQLNCLVQLPIGDSGILLIFVFLLP